MNVLQLDEQSWKHWFTWQYADIFNKNCMAIKNCYGHFGLKHHTRSQKRSAFAKETLKWRTMQYKTKTQYQEYHVHQGPLNTYFLRYWKQFIQTKAPVTEIAYCFNRTQRGNENRHDWRIPHNSPNNNYFYCIVRRYIKLFFHSERPH